MTIDEAIQHCKDEATKLRKGSAKRLQIGLIHAANDCEECAAEHEQLALWLTELKSRRIAAIKELERVKLPKSNADLIRQMTDEELAVFMVAQAIMGAMATSGINRSDAEKGTREIMESSEAQADISETVKWLKQEVSEDATERTD